MSSGSTPGRPLGLVALTLFGWTFVGCAARGRIATPLELATLRQAPGLSAAGRLTLSGPRGKASARVIFGAAPPDSLRVEIPSGASLRFLLVTRGGRLRADLPPDNAMFEGPATAATMRDLFGIDLAPEDLVAALLGSPPRTLDGIWRFERSRPAQLTLTGPNGTTLKLTLDDPSTDAVSDQAFVFGPARPRSLSAPEMSERLGLVR